MRRTDSDAELVVLWERDEGSDPAASLAHGRWAESPDPFWRRAAVDDRRREDLPSRPADWPAGPLCDARYLLSDPGSPDERLPALERARRRWWKGPGLTNSILLIAVSGLFALGIMGMSATRAAAQVTPETPRLLGADVPRGFGLYFVDFGALPGDERGVMATWTGGLPDGFRLRGGWAEGVGGENAGFGGVDLWRSIANRSNDLPVDLLWTTGAAASVGEYTLVSVPLGLTAGRSWSSGSVWLSPWLHAGAVFDLRLGSEAPDGEFEVGLATDIGVHVSFDRARRVVITASAGLGDRQAVAIGMVVGR